jgi:uncharacterized RDD family membrane protein YckC
MSNPDASAQTLPRPWHGEPPTPSAAPQLYGGLILRRSLAYLVDVLIIAVLGFCLGLVLFLAGVLTFGLLTPLGVLVMALWPLAYHSFFVATRGATPGMSLFGLELRDWSGAPVEPLQAILVVLLFYVTISLTAWLVLIVVLLNDRGRALHDILASTVMVRRQAGRGR